MTLTNRLVIFVGAAAGLSASALAQTDLDESHAYQNELLASAQGNTSLLQAGTSGWDPKYGFTLASSDGNYRMNIGYWTQFRYVANFRDNVPSPGEDFTSGFAFAHNRFTFSGNAIVQALTYQVELEIGPSGSFSLRNAYGKYTWDNGWSAKWGQYKLPFLKEELVSDTNQQTVNRSVMNSAFTLGRSQGVELAYSSEEFRFAGDFSDGANALNTDWDAVNEADYAFTGRFDWKFAGGWNQFDQHTSWQGSDFGGYVGVAGNYQNGGSTGSTAGATNDVQMYGLTIDAQVAGNGWNAFASFVYANTDPGAAGSTSFDDFGFLVQGGIFINTQWELFGRFDSVFPDDNRGANIDDFFTVTGGVNYYFIEKSQAAKFTAELEWFIDAPSNTGGLVATPNTAVGLQPSTEDNQIAIMLQMQLKF